MERDAFLARVRAATATVQLPFSPDQDPGLLVPDLPDADLTELFVARAEELDVIVHRPTSPSDVGHVVNDIARGYQAASFMAWDDEHLPVRGVAAALAAGGVTRMAGVVPSAGRLEHQMGYLDLMLGLTGAEAGLAESGSLVLRSGAGRPRMASLVPLVHVALLRTDRIHRSLSHWAAAAAAGIADAANVVFISGPSRTADIEQNINVGVHGPRYVHVILLVP